MKFVTDQDLLTQTKQWSESAWKFFYDFYAPLIRLYGHDCGLKNENLEDLIQNVMVTLSAQLPDFDYDPSKGRFRDYLRRIIRARAFDMLRKIYRQERIPYESGEEARNDNWFEEEWRGYVVKESLGQLKEEVSLHHYQIFYLLNIGHYKVKDLADYYNMPPVTIYTIRNRVEEKLRRIVRELEN